jgi:hypothetical protein
MLKVYTGSGWVTVDDPLIWDGTAWKHRQVSYFDGLEWQNKSVLTGNYALTFTASWDVAGPSVPPPPPTQTYTVTKSFAATWGATYRQDGGKRTDKSDLYQGYIDGYNGNQRSLVGFNITGIPSGATLISATLQCYANHWYNNSGGTLIIGLHDSTSEPGSFPSGTNADEQRYSWNTKTGQRTITLNSAVSGPLLNGSKEGIMFGPAPSTSTTYYGYLEDAGSYRPVLTLKYSYTA